MSSVGHHEPREKQSAEMRSMCRTIAYLMEETEAIDGYNQRTGACRNTPFEAVLAHHRNEEPELASRVLEWIWRKDPRLSAKLRYYLFTEGPLEHQARTLRRKHIRCN